MYSKTGFEPPSLEELQTTLSRLKKMVLWFNNYKDKRSLNF